MSPTLLRSTLILAAIGLVSTPAVAQIPEEYHNLKVLPEDITRPELVGFMRSFSLATGYRCQNCHVAEDPRDFSTYDFPSDEKPLKNKAREMLRMVLSINENFISKLPDRGTPEFEVGCVTCHAGKPRPTTLEQEMTWALSDGGMDAVQARYAELREEYFGLGAYNFGPRALENVAQTVGGSNPEGALGLIELNLEQHPESANSWNIKGSIHALLGQKDRAEAAFQRSLEIAPNNPPAQRGLAQLRGGE
jgi:photosynthetic reaction center cytochrome c subunit/tetratricopeptide repeat protein